MDPRAVARALAEIAETAAETIELQDVFDRVATSVRGLVPFDDMGVVRVIAGGLTVVHATTIRAGGCVVSCWEPRPLEDWSPRLRPRPGPIARLDDAAAQLDPSFPADRDLIEAGVRSVLWQSFHAAGSFSGGVWLSARSPGAFDAEHQEVLRPIAALLGSAVEHWRIWDSERRRRERLDRLEELLEPLAETLDVREVFARVSVAVQPVLPHDLLVLNELEPGGRSFRITAWAGTTDGPEPDGPVALTETEAERFGHDYEIVRDLASDLSPDSERGRVLLSTGMRSWLRVPVYLGGEVRGSLGVLARAAAAYGVDDVEVARRLADRIAVTLSYHRLAEEARIASEARERATRLEATVETLTRELEARDRRRVVGASQSWKQVLRQIGRVAAAETTVLVTGESGTGKEVVSRLIHGGSKRSSGPFVAINCAALPEQLLESELFGHEKGAFTGAVTTKIGRLEQAAGGTLFLDEVGETSPLVQAKLLRVLQEREFQRVGGTRTLRADVRLIAATNRDLAAAIARREFREDLFFRLAVFEIRVPALRERRDDIPALAEVFLEELGPQVGRPAAGISRDAREWLLRYDWPGNVRELRNAIERAILLCDGGLITREHLPAPTPVAIPAGAAGGNGSGGAGAPLPPEGVDLEAVERDYVVRALERTGGNKSRAARLLGLTRAQLYTRIDRYRLG